MAENAWPFYGLETNETQFSQWARSMVDNGILSGLALSAGSGMVVNIASGAAIVRGLYYENTSTKALTVGAAPASGTRTDAIILKLDQTANTITAQIKAGTTGGLPALTQNETIYELLIGTVSVAQGVVSITSAMIAATRPSRGERVLTYTSDALRPTPTTEFAVGVQTTARRIDLWVSGAWVVLSDLARMVGTLGISQGGTGATTRLGARQGMEIYAQPTAPSHVAGRIWIKTPA